MTSLPKTMAKFRPPRNQQIIHRSKGIDKSYPKMCFLLNLSHIVKSYGHVCQILALYNARSSNMIMSRDPGCKFRKLFILS